MDHPVKSDIAHKACEKELALDLEEDDWVANTMVHTGSISVSIR